MFGRRRGLAAGLVWCAFVACGGKSNQDPTEPLRPVGDAGRPSAGAAAPGGSGAQPGVGGTGMTAAGGVVGVVAGTGPSLGGGGGSDEAAGASGGSGRNEAAGAGGMGGDFVIGPGDIDADGCVNLRDWVIFERDFGCALADCGDPRADLHPDGWLDVLDELILYQHWLEGDGCRPRCEPIASGGSGGGGEPSTDLNEDGCVDWDDLELLAESYGCGPDCAAPGADVVADSCVDDVDVEVVVADLQGDAACAAP